MKQIEITVRLNESKERVVQELVKQGFNKIRESDIDDIYMTCFKETLCEQNISTFLRNSILLRKLVINNKIMQKLTYKNKELDENGDVISEQKINVECDNLDNAKRLLECVGFKELVEVKYHVTVYEKNKMELAIQEVKGLGTLIEYENNRDFSNVTIDEINATKYAMYKEIEKLGIKMTSECDVKKAFELIKNKIIGIL